MSRPIATPGQKRRQKHAEVIDYLERRVNDLGGAAGIRLQELPRLLAGKVGVGTVGQGQCITQCLSDPLRFDRGPHAFECSIDLPEQIPVLLDEVVCGRDPTVVSPRNTQHSICKVSPHGNQFIVAAPDEVFP